MTTNLQIIQNWAIFLPLVFVDRNLQLQVGANICPSRIFTGFGGNIPHTDAASSHYNRQATKLKWENNKIRCFSRS